MAVVMTKEKDLVRLVTPGFPLFDGRYMSVERVDKEAGILVGNIHFYGLTYTHFANVSKTNTMVKFVVDERERQKFFRSIQRPKNYGELYNLSVRIKRQINKLRSLAEKVPRDEGFDLDDVTHLYALVKGTIEINEDKRTEELHSLRNAWSALHGLIALFNIAEERAIRGTSEDKKILPYQFVRISASDQPFLDGRYMQVFEVYPERIVGRAILFYDNLEVQVPIEQALAISDREQKRITKWLEREFQDKELVDAGMELCERFINLHEHVRSQVPDGGYVSMSQTTKISSSAAGKGGGTIAETWSLLLQATERLKRLEDERFENR